MKKADPVDTNNPLYPWINVTVGNVVVSKPPWTVPFRVSCPLEYDNSA